MLYDVYYDKRSSNAFLKANIDKYLLINIFQKKMRQWELS